MPWWVGSSQSAFLAAEVFALLLGTGLGQTFNVNYYQDNGCLSSIAHYTSVTINPIQCHNIDDAIRHDGMEKGYTLMCRDSLPSAFQAGFSATGIYLKIDSAGCDVSAETINMYAYAPTVDVCTKTWDGNRDLWYKWSYPSAAVPLCGESLPVPSPPPTVTGDPVTWHGNVREQFVLPPGVLSPLLISPDMQVLASSRPGHEEDEWIDRVVVASPAGEHILDVSIKKNLTYFNRAALPPNAFETLDVKMEWWRPGPLAVMPPGDAQFNHWSGTSLAFGRVRHFGQLKAGPAPRREAAYAISPSLKILILSSSAKEWFIERGGSNHLSMEYSHLDLEIMEIGDESQLRGILPELWGMIPMSEETKALRKLPKEEVDDALRISLPPIVDSSEMSIDGNNSTPLGNCTASGTCMKGSDGDFDLSHTVAIGSVEGFSGGGSAGRREHEEFDIDDVSAAL